MKLKFPKRVYLGFNGKGRCMTIGHLNRSSAESQLAFAYAYHTYHRNCVYGPSDYIEMKAAGWTVKAASVVAKRK